MYDLQNNELSVSISFWVVYCSILCLEVIWQGLWKSFIYHHHLYHLTIIFITITIIIHITSTFIPIHHHSLIHFIVPYASLEIIYLNVSNYLGFSLGFVYYFIFLSLELVIYLNRYADRYCIYHRN